LEELRETGELGPSGVALLYRTLRSVVRTRNLPPPKGEQSWTADALMEAAHEVFAGREAGQRGHARLLILATNCLTEDAFRSKLWTMVLNDLVSSGRRSERGRLAERVKGLCANADDLLFQETRVCYAGAEGADWTFDKIVVALSGVSVSVPVWDPFSPRAAPVVDRASLDALVRAALDVAGSIPLGHLVDAIAVRLRLQDLPDLMETDDLDRRSSLPDVEQNSAIDEAAVQLLAGLTDAQRLVVPYLGDSATDVAERTGLKRTRAWQCVRDVHEIIRNVLAEEDDAPEILRRASEIVVGVRRPMRGS
jgi:hypothetical protein